ncbi:g1190 [Coccomyxa viridis]|uniref:G1190 protein n=1 Tax=Coccomyxa viridis TaxID=1274662 RepID=A0ABP1FHF7_9CHLO
MVTGATVAITVGGVAAGFAGIVWPLLSWSTVAKLEKPKYVVLKTLGSSTRALYDRAPAITLRKYAPYLVAEVNADGSTMKDAISDGFRQVANYIFGNNQGGKDGEKIAMTSPVGIEEDFRSMKGGNGEKIAMTSPVTTSMDGKKYVVSFVMPSKYKTKDDLPKPRNPNLSLREVESHEVAAIAWRGGPWAREQLINAKKEELISVMKAAGIDIEDGPKKLLGYYPPFAPRWIRLQEILLPVKKASE